MTNQALIKVFYESLRTLDVDLFQSIQSDDVVYNIAGESPISGCFYGKKRLLEEVLPLVFGNINPDGYRFSKKWKCICESGDTAVCIMESEGYAANGTPYNQRYVHIFKFAGGKIVGLTEFFDTLLAQRALFSNVDNALEPDKPFTF